MPNRLATETSPYLLQHKDNPVDWYPWGEAALARARDEDRPLLVSIGYSACHWCHVMERESFEDPAVAELMNAHFVCVKVDREERPDVDALYMDAVQAMTGQGGWPLNAFLTPDGVPFYAGTYFPPAQRQGLPSWTQVLGGIAAAWDAERDQIAEQAGRILPRLAAPRRSRRPTRSSTPGAWTPPSRCCARATTSSAAASRARRPSSRPRRRSSSCCAAGSARWRCTPCARWRRAGCTTRSAAASRATRSTRPGSCRTSRRCSTTTRCSRASTCTAGRSPARSASGRSAPRRSTGRCASCAQPEGGFASALDADSEGVEGRYYVWSPDQVRAVLGDELGAVAVEHFGMTEAGNFEGASIPVRATADPPELPEIRRRLYAARERRVRPGLDDKRLTAWNALMISALADAGAVLERRDYVDAAVACAEFVLRDLRDADGRLLRTYNRGQGRLGAYLEDHAFLLEALLTLYEATFDPRWFHAARELADTLLERFADDERGGFFATADDHERLVARRKELEDAPIPSGASAAAFGLLRLAALTGEAHYEAAALGAIRLLHTVAPQHPVAFAHLLCAIDFHLAAVREVALVGDDIAPLERVVRSAFRPHLVVAGGPEDGVPLLAGRGPVGGRAAAYVCERFACRAPVTEPADLRLLLG